jgi:hypothetical protein
MSWTKAHSDAIIEHVDETGRTRNTPKSRGRGRGHRCHGCGELAIASTKDAISPSRGPARPTTAHINNTAKAETCKEVDQTY